MASELLRSEYDELKRRFEGKSMAAYRAAKEGFVLRVLEGRTAGMGVQRSGRELDGGHDKA